MKKLILFGDSLLAGVSKTELLYFEKLLPGYDVYNCAVGGWDTNDCVNKATYIAKLSPDILILSVGTNDASPWKLVDAQKFTANLKEIFSIFGKSKIVYFLPPPINENILAAHPRHKSLTNKQLKDYHDIAKQLCEENTVAYLDSWKVLKPLMDEGNDFHNEDGIHFTDEGYEVVINNLARVVTETV